MPLIRTQVRPAALVGLMFECQFERLPRYRLSQTEAARSGADRHLPRRGGAAEGSPWAAAVVRRGSAGRGRRSRLEQSTGVRRAADGVEARGAGLIAAGRESVGHAGLRRRT